MAHKSTKILIFTTAYRPLIGGSEIAIEQIIKRLPEFFFEIITPRLKKTSPAKEIGGNFAIHRVGIGMTADKFLFPVLGFLKALSLSGGIIHAYQASHGAGAAWLLKFFRPGLPMILTLQEGKKLEKQGWLINFLRKLIIRKTDVATAISEYLKRYILGVKKDLRVELIPNGVDLENFSRQFSYGELTGLETSLGIKPDDKVIISVSRLVNKNGIDVLIEATGLLHEKYSNQGYKLLLVGDGSDREKLNNLAKKMGIKDSVIFAGSVSQEELPGYLKISDIFVRPSRSEGLGSAFLEAMAAGVPVIGTKVGGIPDFLEDRKTGLFCTLNPEELAGKINILVNNDGLKQEIIKNAVLLVKEKYNWDRIANQYRNLYNSI